MRGAGYTNTTSSQVCVATHPSNPAVNSNTTGVGSVNSAATTAPIAGVTFKEKSSPFTATLLPSTLALHV